MTMIKQTKSKRCFKRKVKDLLGMYMTAHQKLFTENWLCNWEIEIRKSNRTICIQSRY